MIDLYTGSTAIAAGSLALVGRHGGTKPSGRKKFVWAGTHWTNCDLLSGRVGRVVCSFAGLRRAKPRRPAWTPYRRRHALYVGRS